MHDILRECARQGKIDVKLVVPIGCSQMPRTYCSQEDTKISMLGTAEQVDVWLMLEYRPAWTAKALQDNSLSDLLTQWLSTSMGQLEAQGFSVRPQFIRQPERDSSDVRLLLGVNGELWEVSGRGYDFLLELNLAEFVANPFGRKLTTAQYFVCTNGQRDLCCARFGLPTYQALRECVGHNAWQVTHLGGHRYAPNVLTLPNAVMYGRVTPGYVPGFVATVEANSLAFEFLRGRTSYPKAVQAAEGMLAIDGLRLLHVAKEAPLTHVRFADAKRVHEIGVRQVEHPNPVLASCGAEPKVLSVFERT